ncbi:hypothetical protein HK096_002471, partial [Nowakowskiella sp. JEL0078]
LQIPASKSILCGLMFAEIHCGALDSAIEIFNSILTSMPPSISDLCYYLRKFSVDTTKNVSSQTACLFFMLIHTLLQTKDSFPMESLTLNFSLYKILYLTRQYEANPTHKFRVSLFDILSEFPSVGSVWKPEFFPRLPFDQIIEWLLRFRNTHNTMPHHKVLEAFLECVTTPESHNKHNSFRTCAMWSTKLLQFLQIDMCVEINNGMINTTIKMLAKASMWNEARVLIEEFIMNGYTVIFHNWNVVIWGLANKGDVESVDKLLVMMFEHIKQRLENTDKSERISGFDFNNISMTVEAGIVLQMKKRNTDRAQFYFDSLIELGILPIIKVYASMIQGYSQNTNSTLALEAYENLLMAKDIEDITNDKSFLHAVASLFLCLSKEGRKIEAYQLIDWMLSIIDEKRLSKNASSEVVEKKSETPIWMVKLYSSMITVFVNGGDYDRAMNLWNESSTFELSDTNRQEFNSRYLKTLLSKDQFDLALVAFELMKKKSQLPVNLRLFTFLITLSIQRNDPEHALLIYNRMRERNIEPDALMYALMIKVHSQKLGNMDISHKLLNVIQTLPDANKPIESKFFHSTTSKLSEYPTPLQLAYTFLIMAYVSNSHLPAALELLESMPQPDIHALTPIITYYKRRRDPQSAIQIVSRFINPPFNIVPDIYSLSMLYLCYKPHTKARRHYQTYFQYKHMKLSGNIRNTRKRAAVSRFLNEIALLVRAKDSTLIREDKEENNVCDESSHDKINSLLHNAYMAVLRKCCFNGDVELAEWVFIKWKSDFVFGELDRTTALALVELYRSAGEENKARVLQDDIDKDVVGGWWVEKPLADLSFGMLSDRGFFG